LPNSHTSYLSIVIILAVVVALARSSVEGRPPRQVLYSHERNGALHSQAAEQQILKYCLAQAILHHVSADRVDINSGVVNKPAEVLGLQFRVMIRRRHLKVSDNWEIVLLLRSFGSCLMVK